MPASKKLLQLCQRFERNLDAYKQGRYKEAQLRKEFIDPLFGLLGWDMDNKKGYAEAYKEAIHEDAIKIGPGTEAPDYCFRIGGVRKFFVEAKKPSIDIKGDIHPAYQLRRYAWSAKLPLSILTDFEELAVYDCRVKPSKTDKSSAARILYFTHKDYSQRWDEIVSIFSPEAIKKGSFDKYAEKKRRGTAEVDAAFLGEIERWRDLLARNIALRNPKLTQRELNFATQRTIDRIIFLRICEDRGIEPYCQLMALKNGINVYKRLMELFNRADDRYNSGLFHFQHEDGRPDESIDAIASDLHIDDKILKDIFKNVYYPDSPYEFSVLPANILGQVYEQFLGKVIRLTHGHRAVVEDKPEVRKAGGVYYTPTYIVDYIVKQTVGKLLDGKQPGPKSPVNKLRILDPACGSGSFLLGAYQYLLDWHRDEYIADDPKKWSRGRSPRLFKTDSGEWKLTIDERKRILMNNIYGVDIDRQAVEVTKLSLLLKVMEDEQSVVRQLSFFRERVLPDLGNNIKCGNSLIGPDFWEGKQMALLDDEEMLRINAFDWEAEFPDIMKAGGFDAVIGNPPYIRIQALKEWAPWHVEYYKQRYPSASKGNYDIYVVFVEKGLALLNPQGQMGYILPHKFFSAKYGEHLRALIAEGNHISRIVHFGYQQVFVGATNYTCLLFLIGAVSNSFKFERVDDLIAWRNLEKSVAANISADKVSGSEWIFNVGKGSDLLNRLSSIKIKLGDIAEKIFQGLVTGADSVFVLRNRNGRIYYSKATQKEHTIEKELLHPLCKGSVNLRRYHVSKLTKSILFPYKITDGKAQLLPVKEFKEKFPRIWDYLLINRAKLEGREHGKWKHAQWYAFGRSQNLSEMEQKKLLTPSIAPMASFTLDTSDFYYFLGSGGGGGGGYGITLRAGVQIEYEYVLGLLNSRLLDMFLKSYSTPFSGGYYAYNRQYIEKLPIRLIDFNDASDKACHDKMVELVKRMLDLQKRLTEAKTAQAKATLKRQIEATDRQIDQLVYKLYDLTEKEIKIVEEGLRSKA